MGKEQKCISLLLLFLSFSFYSTGKVVTYSYPDGIPLSGDYQVWVDEVPQTVIQVPVPASYTAFSMEGKVQVTDIGKWIHHL